MFRKHLMLAAAAVGIAAFALAPSAVKAQAMVQVTASVSNSCQFTTTTDAVGFGNYTGGTITRTYSAKYSCTSGDSTYKFSFKSANGAGAQCRLSDGGTNTLNYVVTDSIGTNFACDGTFFAQASGEGQGIGPGILTYPFTFTLAGNQPLVVGSYSDLNTVTITP